MKLERAGRAADTALFTCIDEQLTAHPNGREATWLGGLERRDKSVELLVADVNVVASHLRRPQPAGLRGARRRHLISAPAE